MEKQQNTNLTFDLESIEPEALIDLYNITKEYLERNSNIKHEKLTKYGYGIDLDSMTKEQSKEFFKICNIHRKKWNIK